MEARGGWACPGGSREFMKVEDGKPSHDTAVKGTFSMHRTRGSLQSGTVVYGCGRGHKYTKVLAHEGVVGRGICLQCQKQTGHSLAKSLHQRMAGGSQK